MSKTCLIVDDVEVTRFTASDFLEDLGFESIEAGNASQAMEKVKVNAVDVILMDWHLSKDSGVELMQKIREETGKNIPTIIMSGVEEQAKAQEALSAGAADYLQKPTTADKLKASLERVGVLGT